MTDDHGRSLWDRYSLSIEKIPGTAVTLIMAAILLPAVMNAMRLASGRPTPADLLVAICISLFSGVIFLWILDAVSILKFRSEWLSKSVYGAAIVSVLGTSVAVYKDYFATRKYIYEAPWALEYTEKDYLKRAQMIILYSDHAGAYWGYSDFDSSDQKGDDPIVWIKIDELDPTAKEIMLQLYRKSGKTQVEKYPLTIERDNKLIISDDKLRLSRPD
jgi:hypothetical protein